MYLGFQLTAYLPPEYFKGLQFYYGMQFDLLTPVLTTPLLGWRISSILLSVEPPHAHTHTCIKA